MDTTSVQLTAGPAVTAVSQLLASSSRLTKLDLSKLGLGDTELEILVCYGLLRNHSLQWLSLRANRITGHGGGEHPGGDGGVYVVDCVRGCVSALH